MLLLRMFSFENSALWAVCEAGLKADDRRELTDEELRKEDENRKEYYDRE